MTIQWGYVIDVLIVTGIASLAGIFVSFEYYGLATTSAVIAISLPLVTLNWQ